MNVAIGQSNRATTQSVLQDNFNGAGRTLNSPDGSYTRQTTHKKDYFRQKARREELGDLHPPNLQHHPNPQPMTATAEATSPRGAASDVTPPTAALAEVVQSAKLRYVSDTGPGLG